jgi:phage terminase Nu1 subunit (DNA packaging protein)
VSGAGIALAPATGLLTVTDLTRALRVTHRQIARWVAAGVPHERDGGPKGRLLFDLDVVQAWRATGEPPPARRGRRPKPPPAPGEPPVESIADVELRKQRAIADKHELGNAKLRGEVVARDAVRDQLSTAFYQLRQRLNALVHGARQSHGDAVAEWFDRELRSALDVLVTEWTRDAALPPASMPGEPPAEGASA